MTGYDNKIGPFPRSPDRIEDPSPERRNARPAAVTDAELMFTASDHRNFPAGFLKKHRHSRRLPRLPRAAAGDSPRREHRQGRPHSLRAVIHHMIIGQIECELPPFITQGNVVKVGTCLRTRPESFRRVSQHRSLQIAQYRAGRKPPVNPAAFRNIIAGQNHSDSITFSMIHSQRRAQFSAEYAWAYTCARAPNSGRESR